VKLRSLRQKILLLFGFILVFAAIRVQVAVDDAAGTLPLTLKLTKLSPQECDSVQVFALSSRAKSRPLTHQVGVSEWKLGFAYGAQTVRLYLPPELRQKPLAFRLECEGKLLLEGELATVLASWKPVPKPDNHPSPLVGFDSPPELRGSWGLLNGPELTPFLEILGQAVGLFVFGLVCVWLSERLMPRLKRPLQVLRVCLHPRAPLSQSRTIERRHALAGLVLLLLGLIVLVQGRRYGFVHDDNLTQFFPVILQGAQSLFDQGVFPTYNPYQLLGSPTATVGTYALTYPPTYLCYAAARWLFRDPYLTLDIFVVMHLVLGYFATFALARRIGLRASLAMCVALSFVLCGYFCVYTRCWFYMAPAALWTPLLFLHLIELPQKRVLTWGWATRTGIVIGLYFHAGNAQMWTYTLLLGAALLLLWLLTGKLSRSQLLWALVALLVGLALAAPLLLPQAAEIAPTDREGSIKLGVLRGLLAILLPAPLATAPHPTIEPGTLAVWKHLYDFGPLYFCSPLFLGAGLLALVSLPFLRWSRRMVETNAWLFCGALALVLSLGEEGGLAQLLAPLPGLNKFQHWWKFLPFVALLFALGGGLLVEGWLRIARKPGIERGILVAVPLLLLYNAAISQPMMELPEKPYPALASDTRALVLNTGQPPSRGIALAPWLPEWKDPGLIAGLSQNFATLYGVPMLEGYDPLVAKSPLNLRLTDRLYASATLKRARQDFDPIPAVEPLTALRRYGVRWAFLTEGRDEIKGIYALDKALVESTTLCQTTQHTQLRELDGSDALAFSERTPQQALPLVLTGEGVQVGLRGTVAGPVIVNFLARERLHAFVDGKPVASEKDAWDRVRVVVPEGAKALTLRYEPAWGKGLAVGGVLLILALGLCLYLSRPLTRA
jgi:hypothetical protein